MLGSRITPPHEIQFHRSSSLVLFAPTYFFQGSWRSWRILSLILWVPVLTVMVCFDVGFQCASQLQVLHRDLKTQNIFLMSNGWEAWRKEDHRELFSGKSWWSPKSLEGVWLAWTLEDTGRYWKAVRFLSPTVATGSPRFTKAEFMSCFVWVIWVICLFVGGLPQTFSLWQLRLCEIGRLWHREGLGVHEGLLEDLECWSSCITNKSNKHGKPFSHGWRSARYSQILRLVEVCWWAFVSNECSAQRTFLLAISYISKPRPVHAKQQSNSNNSTCQLGVMWLEGLCSNHGSALSCVPPTIDILWDW